MTMTLDSNQQRFGPLSNFDHMSPYSSSQPQFTNPWASSSSGTAPQSSAAASHLYAQSGGLGPNSLGLDRQQAQHHPQQQQQHHHHLHQQHHPQHISRTNATSSASLASYGSIPVTSASAGSPLSASMTDSNSVFVGQQDLLSMPQDLLSMSRMPHHGTTTSAPYGDPAYTTTASPIHPTTYAASPTPYDGLGYAPAPLRPSGFPIVTEAADSHRRYSQPSVAPSTTTADWVSRQNYHNQQHRDSLIDFDDEYRGVPQADDRRSFADALEASHGMLSMSQDTPRNIYGPGARGGRGSTDSYGFPSTHSTSSSVSSNGFSGYYGGGGSIDSSVSDYSTAGSDIESISSRTLPRPQGLMATQPPAPQSMMSQFSSKVSSSTQKKHKCKVCDKRFTRPSSLQTHMYSHTGEKPFSCEVEGCGRHFSVVSNLRRHKKVHKNDGRSEAGSEDHHHDHHSD